jgi:hypothetical protein
MRPKPLLVILVLLALTLSAAPAQAGNIVTVCDEAHLLAALAGGGTVTFACSGTVPLTATITIAADTTIDGSGQRVAISGNNAVRVFTVNPGIALNLNWLTVAHGNGDSYGGGIFNNRGILSLNKSIIADNVANLGGGIRNDSGTVNVINSTFSRNNSEVGGAIITAFGTVNVINSTFSENTAWATSGGGISSHQGTVTVSNSTFSDNCSGWMGGQGGGISNDRGTLTVGNSTFLENCGGRGGGIYNTGTMQVSNSTFVGNFSYEGGGIYTGGAASVSNCSFSDSMAFTSGGGIYRASGAITLKNTIVANSLQGGNCVGTMVDGGGNLSYPDTTCPGINGNPLLGVLRDNGGPTHTMALGQGSAALDAANDAICAAPPVNNLDQRGVIRPQGQHCDIGAVEQEPYPPAPFRIWLPMLR